MEQKKEYYAFISYKREDKKEAKWLQHALEYYRLPNQLRQHDSKLPEYVRPIFRDMTDLEVGELSAQIHSALEQSHYLIVVCSPRAATSKWVNDEVEYFISFGKQDKIIPYIIEGIPHASNPAEECYPPVLLRLSKEKELLGANINEVGKDSATIRVVSKMFNIRFDTLYQRYQREQKRRRRQLTVAIILAFLFLSGIAGWILHQNILLKERGWKIMENQARAVAGKSIDLVNDGDSYLARMLTLELLPKELNKQHRPYVIELEAAIRNASLKNNAILHGYEYEISSFSISSTDNYIVSGHYDGNICLWDRKSGVLLNILKGHEKKITDILFYSGDNKIISTSYDNSLKIWDAVSCHCINTIELPYNNPTCISISPDESRLIVGYKNGFISVFDIKDNKCLHSHRVHYASVNHVIWTSDYIITASNDATIKIWNYNEWNCLYSLQGHDSEISSIDISPQGNHLASVSCWDDTIRIWNIQNGTLIKKIEEKTSRFCSIVYSNNGQEVVTTSQDGTIRIWDISDEIVVNTIDVYPEYPSVIKYGTTEKFVVTPSKNNTLRITDLKDIYREIWDGNPGINGRSAAINLQKNILAFSINEDIIIINLETMQTKRWYANVSDYNNITFSPNGLLLAYVSSNHKLHVWNIETCRQVLEMNVQGHYITFSPNGKHIACSGKTTKIFDISTKTLLKEIPNTYNSIYPKMENIAYSSDGQYLASIYDEHNIVIICIDSGNICDTLNCKQRISSMQWGVKENTLLVTSESPHNEISVWNFKTNQKIKFYRGHTNDVLNATYTEDGNYIISCASDNTLKIWDAESGYILLSLYAPISAGSKAILSKDGDHIYIGSIYGVFEWKFPTLIELINDNLDRFKNRNLTQEERRKYYLE